jgi:hypothetical protein
MEDLVGNEENGYPVPDPNKTMVNVSNEPRHPLKISQVGNNGRGQRETHGEDCRHG